MPNIIYGNNFNITATVISSNPRLNPTGVVVFKDGVGLYAKTIGVIELQVIGLGVSIAMIVVSSVVLGPGIHNIIGNYAGDENFAAASSLPEVKDIVATTTLTLLSTGSPTNYGSVIAFTAELSNVGPVPTGNIIFYDGITNISGNIVVNGSGNAIFNTGLLSVSTHSITAQYGGDSDYFPITSTNTIIQVVNKSTPPVVITSSENPANNGDIIIFTATVAPIGSGVIPSGTVTFYDSATPISSALALVSGTITFSTGSLSSATHTITAQYSGDSNYSIATSNTISQIINSALPTAFANLWQWVSADSGVITSGTNVTGWTDQSGNTAGPGWPVHSFNMAGAHPAPQSNGTLPGGSGKPAILFNSTSGDDIGLGASDGGGGYPACITFVALSSFIVLSITTEISYARILNTNYATGFFVGLDVNGTRFKFWVNGTVLGNPFGTCQTGIISINTPYLLTCTFDPSNPGSGSGTATIQLNGTTAATQVQTSVTNITQNAIYMGVDGQGGQEGLYALIAESALYTDVKSGSDLINLNRYFGNKYGITVP